MPLKFSANLSTMFREVDFLDRFEKAKEYGFEAIEIQSEYIRYDPDVLKSKMGDLKADLLNMPTDTRKFGCASLPDAVEDFAVLCSKVSSYRIRLGINKLHILCGEKSPSKYSFEDQFQTLVSGLKNLVEHDYFEIDNLIGLIEPKCDAVIPNYFLNSFETAVQVIKAVGSDNVKLLLDIYHLHEITGDVKKYLDIYYPYAGHIQISQSPNRTEPFGAGGHIDYVFVLDYLRKKNHKDFIGLEYVPSGSTEESVSWMKNYM